MAFRFHPSVLRIGFRALHHLNARWLQVEDWSSTRGRSYQRSRPSQQLVFYSRVLLGILQFYRVSWSGQIYFLGVDKKEEEEGKNDPWVYVPFNLQFTNGRPSSLIVWITWHCSSCCYCDCCLWRMDRVKREHKYRMSSGEGSSELNWMTTWN